MTSWGPAYRRRPYCGFPAFAHQPLVTFGIWRRWHSASYRYLLFNLPHAMLLTN